jgi:hypothetical protein
MGHRVQTFRICPSGGFPVSKLLGLPTCPELAEGLTTDGLFSSNLHVFPQRPLEAEASQFFLQSSINIHV